MNHKSIAQILEILYRKAYKSKLKDQKLTELSEELKMDQCVFQYDRLAKYAASRNFCKIHHQFLERK
jgi:hypothetical protein